MEDNQSNNKQIAKNTMNIAIILSGGVGSRMGLNIPKQYVMVNEQPILYYCLQTFLSNENIDALVIGVADDILQEFSKNPQKKFFRSKSRAIEYNGNYNGLDIEPSGRLMSFYPYN